MTGAGRIAKFAAAGAIGFLVDVAVLALVVAALGPYGGRIVSFIMAATSTWLINRRFAFADRTSTDGPATELLRYLAVMLVGGVVNYAAFSVIVSTFGDDRLVLFVGVAVGSLLGMGINLAFASRFVFPHPRTEPEASHE